MSTEWYEAESAIDAALRRRRQPEKDAIAEIEKLRAAVRGLLADREAWRIARDTRDRARAALGEKP